MCTDLSTLSHGLYCEGMIAVEMLCNTLDPAEMFSGFLCDVLNVHLTRADLYLFLIPLI